MGKKKEVVEAPRVEAPAGYVLGTNIPRDPRKNKVAIVGFAPSSMADVKLIWDDPTLEVWGLNQLYMAFPMMQQKASRWFQIHHRHTYDVNFGRDHSHHKWLAEQKEFPIYMQNQEPDIPASVRYPKEELLKTFYRRYFTNSISWMLATAIYETLKAPPGMGFKEIYMFGVDMAQDGEYAFERPSVEYFCGWIDALESFGHGTKLLIPEKSDICKTVFIYPFEDTAPIKAKFVQRRKELRDRVNQAAGAEQGAHDERLQLIGALDNMNYLERSWFDATRAHEGLLPAGVKENGGSNE